MHSLKRLEQPGELRIGGLGLHPHVPVVDERETLVGMVTQSDLIAALYRRIALASA